MCSLLSMSLLALLKFSYLVSEICRQFEVLQLEFFNEEAVSDACVYLIDPHNLPRPAKDSSGSAIRSESNTDDGIRNFQYEKTNEQDQLGMQYKVNDMSISSDSDFEETLLNHFQCTSKFKSDDSSTDFASPSKRRRMNHTISTLTASAGNSKFHTDSREGKFSLQNVTEIVSTSSSKSLSGEGRKRRITTDHLDECSSPVRHFCSASLVASTPLSTQPKDIGTFFALILKFLLIILYFSCDDLTFREFAFLYYHFLILL